MMDFVNKIIHGDSLEVMRKMPDNFVDAVVTDPPFGIGFKYGERKDVAETAIEYWKWFEPFYKEIIRITKDGGFIAIWQTQLYFPNFWAWYGKDIRIYAGCKNFIQIRKTPINYSYDPIVMFYKQGTPLKPAKPKRNLDHFVANTAKFVSQKNSIARRHPCPRPVDQVKEIISNFTLEEGIVLDPFAGSGTLAEACLELNRNFICIEKDSGYIRVCNDRLANYQPVLSTKDKER